MSTHYAYKLIQLPETNSIASIGAPKSVTLETLDGKEKHLVYISDVQKDIDFDGEQVLLVRKTSVIAIKTVADFGVPVVS